jgi:hypothetical protein
LDEAAPSELGVATPQAMKLAIAASHSGEIWEKLIKLIVFKLMEQFKDVFRF